VPNFDEWKERQNLIYANIEGRRQTALTEGLRPDLALVERKGGYVIALIPSFAVKSQCVRLWGNYPAVCDNYARYFSPQLHTTLSDYGVKPGYDPSFDPNKDETLKRLTNVALEVWMGIHSPVCCRYEGIIFDQSTVIAKGIPDASFVDLASKLVEEGKRQGVELRMPWGAHITLARACKQTGPEGLADLPLGPLPEGPLAYTGLAVGYMVPTPTSFHVHFTWKQALPA
jgi:hypothetical protein